MYLFFMCVFIVHKISIYVYIVGWHIICAFDAHPHGTIGKSSVWQLHIDRTGV